LEDTAQRVGRKRQLLYILTPLFLLILCLGTINVAPALVTIAGADPVTPAPTVALAPTIAAEATVSPFSDFEQDTVPTATSLATPTEAIVPTIPPGVEIQLLGPPPGSAFRIGDTLSFYWQWSLPLAEDQSLALYLLVQDQELLLGRLDEANVGHSYRLHVPVGDSSGAAGKVQWQVRLESNHAKQWLVASEIRLLALLAAPEPTP